MTLEARYPAASVRTSTLTSSIVCGVPCGSALADARAMLIIAALAKTIALFTAGSPWVMPVPTCRNTRRGAEDNTDRRRRPGRIGIHLSVLRGGRIGLFLGGGGTSPYICGNVRNEAVQVAEHAVSPTHLSLNQAQRARRAPERPI